MRNILSGHTEQFALVIKMSHINYNSESRLLCMTNKTIAILTIQHCQHDK